MIAANSRVPAAAAFDQQCVDNPEARKLESYPGLDWLRFVLASLVALGHEGMPAIGPIGANLAVDVFLALSGWLIGGILVRTEAAELPRFFFNRATRIWLPYAAAILLIYGLAAVKEGVHLNWFKYLFYDVTFTHYNFTVFPRAGSDMPMEGTGNHFWSLSVEEQFYLAAPVVMFLLPWGKKLAPWLLLFAGLLLLGERAAPIAAGVIAAILQRDYGDWHVGTMGRLAVLAALAAFFTLMCWRADLWMHAPFALLAVLALAIPGRRGRIGLFLGAISYPLYLNHWLGAFIGNGLAKFVPLATPLKILLSYGAALAVGIVAWAAIDRWVMARRGEWYTPTAGRTLAILAYALVLIGLAGGTAIRLWSAA